jgi:hypothetical protein
MVVRESGVEMKTGENKTPRRVGQGRFFRADFSRSRAGHA